MNQYPRMASFLDDVDLINGILSQLADEGTLQPMIEPIDDRRLEWDVEDSNYDDHDDFFEDFEEEDEDESMDGDFDSAMRDAGFGTDEDYGYYGDGEDY